MKNSEMYDMIDKILGDRNRVQVGHWLVFSASPYLCIKSSNINYIINFCHGDETEVSSGVEEDVKDFLRVWRLSQ